MPESVVVRSKRDTQWIIYDSGGLHSYTGAYEPGDLAFEVPEAAITLILNRGQIGSTPSIRLGDEAPVTGSLTVHQRDIADTAATKTYATVIDIVTRFTSGYVATNWTSTLGSSSDVTTWTLAVTIDGSAFGEADKTLTFPFTVFRGGWSEGDSNSYKITFTSYCQYGKPTVS
jgi:hypothetical protein